jgi:hypothetical protein
MTASTSGTLRPSRSFVAFACLALALLGADLWLVADDEVVASPNRYDELRYAEMAQEIAAGRWLGPYGPLTLVREPGYPLWLALVSQSGLRLRVAAELLMAGSAFLLGAALLGAGASVPAAAAVFGGLVLQPHAFLVNRQLLPGGFYAALLVAALAGLIRAAGSVRPAARLGFATASGLAFAWLAVTRPEVLLLPVIVLGSALTEWVLRRGEPLGRRLLGAALLAGPPVLCMAAAVWGISALQQRHYGLWAVSERSAPGFQAAQRALLSVEPTHPRRFVPVPADVRTRAYAASPAFRQLEDELEAESWARQVSCAQARICHDLSASVFPWRLREAAAAADRMPNARAADRFFQRVADELFEACARGALDCRPARMAFPDPHLGTWLPHLPASLAAIAARMGTAGRPRDRDPPRDDRQLPARLRAIFDDVARRRPELTSADWFDVRGYAESQSGVTRVALLLGGDSTPLAVTPPDAGVPRLDFAFRFEQPAGRRALDGQLVVERGGDVRDVLPLSSLLREPAAAADLRVVIRDVQPFEPEPPWRRRVRHALWDLHALWMRLGTAAALGAGVLLAAPSLRPERPRAYAVACAAVALAVATRLGLLAVVDASAFPADTSRYLHPAIGLTSCLLVLLIDAAVAGLRRPRAVAP